MNQDLPLSVIVPSYNPGARFRTCLQALTAEKLVGQFAVVVLDGCTDDSAGLVAQGSAGQRRFYSPTGWVRS